MIRLTEIYNAGHVKYLTPDINDIIHVHWSLM